MKSTALFYLTQTKHFTVAPTHPFTHTLTHQWWQWTNVADWKHPYGLCCYNLLLCAGHCAYTITLKANETALNKCDSDNAETRGDANTVCKHMQHWSEHSEPIVSWDAFTLSDVNFNAKCDQGHTTKARQLCCTNSLKFFLNLPYSKAFSDYGWLILKICNQLVKCTAMDIIECKAWWNEKTALSNLKYTVQSKYKLNFGLSQQESMYILSEFRKSRTLHTIWNLLK